uniref:Ig-like domain-containing protein n=1 Tax=Astyanax mexicanus TaxID=7994 RepID=A0A8B9L5N4_ASTMX
FLVSFSLGFAVGHQVDQFPSNIVKNQTESAEISCSHSVKDFEHILWFKQSEDKILTFLGYLNRNYPYPDAAFTGKIQLDGDGNSAATLTISNLMANDSAVYFCAARRHSISRQPPSYSGVTQSPEILYVEKGKPATMNCRHNKGLTYIYMYWFRQYQGKSLELIVFKSASSEDFGSFSKTKYSAYKKEAETDLVLIEPFCFGLALVF